MAEVILKASVVFPFAGPREVLRRGALALKEGRILAVEHQLYPGAIRLFAEDRLRVDGRRVVIDGTPTPVPPPLLPLPKSSIGA